jgi:hypothetical protein
MTDQTPTTEQIPAALDVTLSIPMAQLLGSYTQRPGPYSSDPDDYQEEPPVVLDAIGERVAQMLLARFEADARKAVQSKLDAALRDRIDAIVTEALEGEFQPLNHYGEKSGSPTTVRGMAVKMASEWFEKEIGDYNRRQKQGHKYIEQAVDKAMKEDLDAALRAARVQVTKRLQEKAAEAIAATIASMGGVR